jgi:hypothetical protein
MPTADSKFSKALETAVVYGVGFPVVGLFMGGIYSVPAISVCKGREPWLSVLLSLGLAATSFGLGYLGGTPILLSAGGWLFCVALLLITRRLRGNLDDNLERFGLVHAVALLIAIVLATAASA